MVDLVKRYRRAESNAVDGISFEVGPGQLFALLGPNGAGKTTTISILTTTLTPTSGSVRIAGLDVVTQSSQVRRQVGIIFQTPSLDLNLTGEENVRFHCILYGVFPYRPGYGLMPAEYRRRVAELAEVLGVGREMFQPAKTYSGGMKRKLEIVRSLMHRPRVLFLDEPTAGLDAGSRRNLWQYLAQVRREHGTTVFLTTHYLEEAEQAEQVCVVNRGRVVANGSPRELKSQLVHEYLLIDSEDRARLLAELEGLGLRYTVADQVQVELGGRTVHELLRSIATPINTTQVHAPSLEDAYLEIVSE